MGTRVIRNENACSKMNAATAEVMRCEVRVEGCKGLQKV